MSITMKGASSTVMIRAPITLITLNKRALSVPFPSQDENQEDAALSVMFPSQDESSGIKAVLPSKSTNVAIKAATPGMSASFLSFL